MRRILLAYASSHGQTRKIAEAIAAELRDRGNLVELTSVFAGPPPSPHEYDAVVLGSRIQNGRHAEPMIAYIKQWRSALRDLPSYFFSVSASAANQTKLDPHDYLERLFTQTRWRPREAVAIGGALAYRQYGIMLRFVMKLLARRAGHPTDTSRDHELTDWSKVKRFAQGIAADLARPPYHIGARAQA